MAGSNGNSYQKDEGPAYQPISVNGEGKQERFDKARWRCKQQQQHCGSHLISFSVSEDDTSTSGKRSKIIIGAVVLVAIAGVAAFMFTGPKRSSLHDAVKTAGLNVTANGKLKLFDAESKCTAHAYI